MGCVLFSDLDASVPRHPALPPLLTSLKKGILAVLLKGKWANLKDKSGKFNNSVLMQHENTNRSLFS